MPLAKELYTLLPIYDNIEKQIRYNGYCNEPLFINQIPSDKLPEFAYLREINPTFNFTLSVRDLEGNEVANFTEGELGPLLTITTYDDGTELVALNSLFDSFGSGEELENGKYYLVLTDGVDTYYSEVFEYSGFLSDDIDCMNKFMFVTTCQVGDRYPSGFTQHFYTDIQIGLPEYPYTSQNHETTDGTEVVDWRKVDKMRKFFLYGPEYVCDFFSLVPMFDQVTYEDPTGTMTIESALTDIVFDEANVCEAMITVQFLVSSVTKNTCCTPTEVLDIESPTSVCTVQAKVDCNEGEWPTSYSPSGGGGDVDFVTGDYILGCCDGNCFIYLYMNGQYVIQPQLNIQGNVVFDQDTSTYWHYFSGGFNVPYLYLTFVGTSPTGVFKGYAPDGFMCELQKDNAGSWDAVGSAITSEQFSSTGFASATYALDDYRVKVYNHSQEANTNEYTVS